MVQEEVVAEHACKTTRTFIDGPRFVGDFTDGQEYRGQHARYDYLCAECGYVVRTEGGGPCYTDDEISRFGSFWSARQQTFCFLRDKTNSWAPWRLSPKQRQAIADFYRGNDRPKIEVKP